MFSGQVTRTIDRTATVVLVVFGILVGAGCLLLCMLGCAASAGPGITQGVSGQTATNTGGDKLTVTDSADGTGTTTLAGTGPSFFSNQDSATSAVRGTGLVPTQVIVERPDGAKFTYFSAKDGTGNISMDEQGNPKSIVFTAGASDPLRAFAEVAAIKADLEKSITAEQAAYLKQFSSDQKETILGVVDKVSPVLSAALRAAWPAP